jgi:hypothetical protein
LARRVRHARYTHSGDESVEQGPADFGRRSAREARTQAAARIGCQRELGDQQQRSPDIADRPIHLSGGVGEDAVRQEPLGEPHSLAIAIATLDTDQNEHPKTNFTDN